MIEETAKSLIAKSFKDQTVFVTGGTGFLGKVVLEKILRSCADLKTMYLLIRPKKGKTELERIKELFNKPCFKPLKKIHPEFADKVKIINGDCELPNLGLSKGDQNILEREVTTIFHIAATIRFGEHIKIASYINVRATRDLLRMSKNMTNLKAFIHVSTAYSNCPQSKIEEKIYDGPITGEELLGLVEVLDDNVLEKINKNIIKEWPNRYAFTKAVAEHVLKLEGHGLPIAVVRPSVVIAAMKEPMPGWIDTMQGLIGAVILASLGLMRTTPCKINALTEFVPVDYVANCMIAAAWDIANNRLASEENDGNVVPIYNYVCSPKMKMTYDDFLKFMCSVESKYTPMKQVLPRSLPSRPNLIHHWFAVVFYNYLPAYIIDFGFKCLRKKPIGAVEIARKVEKFNEYTGYFQRNTWQWQYDSVPRLYDKMSDVDKKLFDFDIKEEGWYDFIESCLRGGRIYLLNDPMETLLQARKRIKNIKLVYNVFWIVFYYLIFRLVMYLFSFIF